MISVLFDLGKLKLAQGMDDAAFDLHQRTLKIREDIMPLHDKTGHTMHKVAIYFYQRRNNTKAMSVPC